MQLLTFPKPEDLNPTPDHKAVIECLESALELAKAGGVESVMVIVLTESEDGDDMVGMYSAVNSAVEAAGLLAIAQQSI